MGIILVFIGYWLLMKFKGTLPAPFGMGKPSANLDISYNYGVLRGLLGFLLGIFTYYSYQKKDGFAWLKKSSVFLVAFLVAAIAMSFFLPDVLIVAFFPIIILSAAHNTTHLTSFLNTTVMQKLGDWSYSIYLLQYPLLAIYVAFMWLNHPEEGLVLAILKGYPPTTYLASWTLALTWIAVTIFCSALTYRYIEVPARKWINEKLR